MTNQRLKHNILTKPSSRIFTILLVIYIACILYLTLICRQSQGRIIEFVPFWSYAEAIRGAQGMWFQILANIAIFVPLGILAGGIKSNQKTVLRAAIIGFALSAVIESCQYIFAIGTCEIDDLIDNTAGAVIGALLLLVIRRFEWWRIFAFAVGAVACIGGIAYCASYDFTDNSAARFAFQVDDVAWTEDELKIEGYTFMYRSFRNEDTITGSEKDMVPEIYLKASDGAGRAKQKMELEYGIAREDVNEYYKCDFDYTNCGFAASIDGAEVDPDREYEILVKYPGVFAPFHSGSFLRGDEVYHISRSEYEAPDVKGTDLEEICRLDRCLVYRPDRHCRVYQYDGCLYWVVDDQFDFESDGSTYIQYQLDTTQFDRLPADRLEGQWYWSNIGGNFEDYEVTGEMDCGRYRVCRREIPREYSVTAIYTGYYKDEHWVWEECFRGMVDVK